MSRARSSSNGVFSNAICPVNASTECVTFFFFFLLLLHHHLEDSSSAQGKENAPQVVVVVAEMERRERKVPSLCAHKQHNQPASKHIKCRKQEESETEATAVITRTVHFRKYCSSNVLFYPSTTNQREPLWLLLLCDTQGVKDSSRVSVSLQRDGFHLPPCTLRGVRARL